jgi:hypothetical protein
MPQYLEIKDIAAHFGKSYDFARDLVFKSLDHRLINGTYLVEKKEFDRYLRDSLIQAGTPAPRKRPYKTPQQESEDKLKAWHRAKRAAQAAR